MVLGLGVLLVSGIAWSHPLKMSSALIEHNPEKETIRLECKVFIDDFQLSILDAMEKGVVPVTTERSKRHLLIESYFGEYFIIGYNEKVLPLKLKSVTPLSEQNVFQIQFVEVPLKLRNRDRLVIKNTLMFKDFGLAQTNRFIVRIPAFKFQAVQAATIENHYFSYTIGEAR